MAAGSTYTPIQTIIKSNNDFNTSGLLNLIRTSKNTSNDMINIPASKQSNMYGGLNIYF
jgi:hypothetical protein